MKNMLMANAGVSFVLEVVTFTNLAFALEGNSPFPEYMRTVFIADFVEIAFWVLAGIVYLGWLVYQRKSRRRLGILRYDGRRGEWYYQR